MTNYDEFLAQKRQLGGEHGFAPTWLPDFLFPFQRALVEWATRKGRAARGIPERTGRRTSDE